jgi:hypothetical protein
MPCQGQQGEIFRQTLMRQWWSGSEAAPIVGASVVVAEVESAEW